MSVLSIFLKNWASRQQIRRPSGATPLSLLILEDRITPSDATTGTDGINSRGLNLTGAGVLIGQIESTCLATQQ